MAKNTDLKSALGQLEETLETYLIDKAPFSIPENWKELIVRFAPWVTLVLMIMALPTLLAIFGLGTMLAPFGYLGSVRWGYGYLLTVALSLVIMILEALAIPGLFKRKKSGWRFLYYAALVNIVLSLIVFDLGGLIIGGLISLYVLFQVKEYYS